MTTGKTEIVPWRAELWQDGMVVASVEGSNRGFVEREIGHYAAQYAQDGPVEVKIKLVSTKR